MKITKVIAVHKPVKKQSLVIIDQFLSYLNSKKSLKNVFYKRLECFFKKHNIMSENQYGFKHGKSTEFAISELMEEIPATIDNNMSTIGVIIGSKKAFDTVNHKILMDKLEHNEVRDAANKWIVNYLNGGQQYVQIDNVHSGSKKVIHGIPQVSILGPRLFITYINDMCNVSSFLKYILFTDDTTILRSWYDIKLKSKEVIHELI